MELKDIQEKLEGLGSKFEAKANEIAEGKNAELKKELETQLAEIKSNLSGFAKSEGIEELKTQLNALEGKFAEKKPETKTLSLVEEIKQNQTAINEIVRGKIGEVELKANTVTASVVDSTASFRLPEIGQLGVKRRGLYDVLPKVSVPIGTHNGKITYIDWDEETTVRAADSVAEGTAFPESTARFKEYNEKLGKIGDTLPVSEEFGEDYTSAAAELDFFLQTNVDQKCSDELINGDGTGNGFKGLLNRAPVFTAPSNVVAFANLKDLAKKMKVAITKTRGSKYIPDIVVMNSETWDKFTSTKDTQGRYLFDDDGRLAGLTVVEDNFMADNVMVVGDRRYARLYEMAGIVLSEGTKDAQFTEDMKTLKARKRMLMLIREVDRTGFLKVTDITAALNTMDENIV